MSEFKEYHNANHHDGDDTFDDQKYKMTNGDDFDCSFVQDCYDHFEAGQQSRQAEIDDLKAQLTNMEQCYIGIKQEHNELIAFNTEIDRKQKVAEKTAEKYKFKVSMIADLLRDCVDQDMTLKAIKTVIDRVGES